jgi:membrane associated rhomboid family serine protease
MDERLGKKVRPNPNKKSKRNRNLEQVLQRPTTTLLLALNILLAFIYWNRNTNPSHVAKVYNKIVVEGELWRCFSGATAHFEPLHLGFNMMTLYSLGTELEPSYGSIPFLFYNMSLIPITTLIMMSIVYLQIRKTGNAALGETSTIGSLRGL